MFANPSVQITTADPTFPLLAIYIDERIAGPKAVAPEASILLKLFKILSYDYLTED
jgi:hypothetical protein